MPTVGQQRFVWLLKPFSMGLGRILQGVSHIVY